MEEGIWIILGLVINFRKKAVEASGIQLFSGKQLRKIWILMSAGGW